ncbi:MAG TPA: GNAT family N-acetyltransferase [Candidatus Nanopelagicales bacterium]|nr:GNAT family N-acetyltransferase [Candidatus Nanopelagicales bacterium]
MTDVEIVDVPDDARWEARLGDVVTGFADYRREGAVVEFTHAEVQPEYEGRGIAGAIARTSLDAARAAGLRVIAGCPFYAGWIAQHPDYQDLLAES